MNNRKTVARYFSLLTITASFLSVLAGGSFAQSNLPATLSSFNNLVAAADKNDDTIKRPRVVAETKETTEKSDVPAPAVTASATASTTGVAALASQMEHLAFAILNQKRAENNLPPLEWSEDMAKIARMHSKDMADNKFFSHQGRDGSMVDDRADTLGFSKWKAIGENIAYNRGYDKPADFACERWMLSQSHRENILNPRWKEAGIGVSITADGTYYFTEVFILK